MTKNLFDILFESFYTFPICNKTVASLWVLCAPSSSGAKETVLFLPLNVDARIPLSKAKRSRSPPLRNRLLHLCNNWENVMLNGANLRERLAMENPGYRHLVSSASHVATLPLQGQASVVKADKPNAPQPPQKPVERLVWHCLWNPDGD